MKSNNTTKFNESVINWDELNKIGVTRDSLQKSNDLELLLNGRETQPVIVNITILEQPQEVEVTLQLIEQEGTVILQLTGTPGNKIKEEEEN